MTEKSMPKQDNQFAEKVSEVILSCAQMLNKSPSDLVYNIPEILTNTLVKLAAANRGRLSPSEHAEILSSLVVETLRTSMGAISTVLCESEEEVTACIRKTMEEMQQKCVELEGDFEESALRIFRENRKDIEAYWKSKEAQNG